MTNCKEEFDRQRNERERALESEHNQNSFLLELRDSFFDKLNKLETHSLTKPINSPLKHKPTKNRRSLENPNTKDSPMKPTTTTHDNSEEQSSQSSNLTQSLTTMELESDSTQWAHKITTPPLCRW